MAKSNTRRWCAFLSDVPIPPLATKLPLPWGQRGGRFSLKNFRVVCLRALVFITAYQVQRNKSYLWRIGVGSSAGIESGALDPPNTVHHPSKHHTWTQRFKSKTQQTNCRNIKGATVVAVVVCATKPTLLLMYWELITCRTIDVVRFQQLRCNKRSSLTRKAALSANVLLRHQAVPAPLGLRVQRGETARHNPITLMQYNPITLIRYHAWRASHPEPRFFTDAEMDIAV